MARDRQGDKKNDDTDKAGGKLEEIVDAMASYINSMTQAPFGRRTPTESIEKAVKGSPLVPIYDALQGFAQVLYVAQRAALHGFHAPQDGEGGPSSPFDELSKQNSLISDAMGRLSKNVSEIGEHAKSAEQNSGALSGTLTKGLIHVAKLNKDESENVRNVVKEVKGEVGAVGSSLGGRLSALEQAIEGIAAARSEATSEKISGLEAEIKSLEAKKLELSLSLGLATTAVRSTHAILTAAVDGSFQRPEPDAMKAGGEDDGDITKLCLSTRDQAMTLSYRCEALVSVIPNIPQVSMASPDSPDAPEEHSTKDFWATIMDSVTSLHARYKSNTSAMHQAQRDSDTLHFALHQIGQESYSLNDWEKAASETSVGDELTAGLQDIDPHLVELASNLAFLKEKYAKLKRVHQAKKGQFEFKPLVGMFHYTSSNPRR